MLLSKPPEWILPRSRSFNLLRNPVGSIQSCIVHSLSEVLVGWWSNSPSHRRFRIGLMRATTRSCMPRWLQEKRRMRLVKRSRNRMMRLSLLTIFPIDATCSINDTWSYRGQRVTNHTWPNFRCLFHPCLSFTNRNITTSC